jgi:hypothetical protein
MRSCTETTEPQFTYLVFRKFTSAAEKEIRYTFCFFLMEIGAGNIMGLGQSD